MSEDNKVEVKKILKLQQPMSEMRNEMEEVERIDSGGKLTNFQFEAKVSEKLNTDKPESCWLILKATAQKVK